MKNGVNKLFAATLMALIAVAPAIAQSAGKIRVCVAADDETPTLVLLHAEAVSTRMFAPAGVTVEWRSKKNAACRGVKQANTLEIGFMTNTPTDHHPGALAYAQPQSAKIVVMIDRIDHSVNNLNQRSAVLAHVMTHEIAHLLEGVSRHSETGIMKAHWDPRDFDLMTYRPLPFAPEDIDLIRQGMAQYDRLPGLARP